jgi:DNA-binding ferritin-like protein
MEVIHKELELSEDSLRKATDPRINVERRDSLGGPAPFEVERMIKDRRIKIKKTEKRQISRLEKYHCASNQLEKAIDEIIHT